MKEKNAEKTKISLRFQMQGMIQSLHVYPFNRSFVKDVKFSWKHTPDRLNPKTV
jgi:hypothetical protein